MVIVPVVLYDQDGACFESERDANLAQH